MMDPASPQWGRNWKEFSPRSLEETPKRNTPPVTTTAPMRRCCSQAPPSQTVNSNELLVSRRRKEDSLSEVVEDHDVGVHVEQVVAVRRVVIGGPLLRFRAPV